MTALRNPTVVFSRAGAVVTEDRAVRSPDVGEVLIETRSSLISAGTELAILNGEVESVDFPFAPGYCNVGTVVEIGPDVERSLAGRQVVSLGSHARYVTVPATAIRPCDDLAPDDAVFCVLAEIVLNGLRRANLVGGESVAIVGLGLIGQLTVRLALVFGARPIIAVDLNADRRGRVPEHPAIVAASDVDDARVLASAQTAGRLCDVVFEITGNAGLIPREFGLLRPQGRFVQLGSPRGGPSTFDFYELCHRHSYTIIGAHNMSHPAVASGSDQWTMHRHAEFFFDLIRFGDLELGSLISRRIGPFEAGRLYSNLQGDPTEHLGVLIDWAGA